MKTFTFKATEEELMALIRHHSFNIHNDDNPNPEMSERLHFLMKKLHKDTPDVEETKEPTAAPEAMVTSGASRSGW